MSEEEINRHVESDVRQAARVLANAAATADHRERRREAEGHLWFLVRARSATNTGSTLRASWSGRGTSPKSASTACIAMVDYGRTAGEPNPREAERVGDMDDLLRPMEARDLLNVGRTWLRERTTDGRIPSVRIGGPDGPLRYRRRDLAAALVPNARSDACMSPAEEIEVVNETRRGFFTPLTLARYLSVHERTIRQWLADGVIPSYLFEGSRRIAAEDVDRYVESRRAVR